MGIHGGCAVSDCLLFIAVIDSLITAGLLIATILQSSFIGLSSSQCARLSSGPDISDGEDATKLLVFVRAARLKDDDPSYANRLCDNYRSWWHMGIDLRSVFAIIGACTTLTSFSCLYGISAITCFWSGCCYWDEDHGDQCGCSHMGIFVMRSTRSVSYLPMRLLPPSARRRLHYATRYMDKISSHLVRLCKRFMRKTVLLRTATNDFELNTTSCSCREVEEYKCWCCAKSVCKVCQYHFSPCLQKLTTTTAVRSIAPPSSFGHLLPHGKM